MTLTSEDIQALKAIFATKEDIAALTNKFATKDDLAAFATKADLQAFKQDLLREVDAKLETHTSAILGGVRSYLENNVVPFLLDHEKRLDRIEDQLDLPPLPAQ